jgi:TonB family protein
MDRRSRSTPVCAVAVSLLVHVAGLSGLYWLAERWVSPALLSVAFGSRSELAVESSWAEAEEAIRFDAPMEMDAAAPVPRREASRILAPSLAPVDAELEHAVVPAASVDSQTVSESRPIAVSSRPPRRTVSSATSMPAVAAVSLPTAPFRFVGPPCRYPAAALAVGWEGTVVLLVHLGSDGTVTRVEIETSSGFPAADEEAVRTVSTWRAVPVHPGEPLTISVVRQPVQFTLRGA